MRLQNAVVPRPPPVTRLRGMEHSRPTAADAVFRAKRQSAHFTFRQQRADCIVSPMTCNAMSRLAGRAPRTHLMRGTPCQWLSLLMLPTALFVRVVVAQPPSSSTQGKGTPLEIVLVEAKSVTPAAVSQWKKEGFQAVAIVLDERTDKAAYRDKARNISDGGLDLYCWIEVARNPKLAAAHPRWVATLGSHDDWQKNFPNCPEPGAAEVAKAFPWVPIGYRETFAACFAAGPLTTACAQRRRSWKETMSPPGLSPKSAGGSGKKWSFRSGQPSAPRSISRPTRMAAGPAPGCAARWAVPLGRARTVSAASGLP